MTIARLALLLAIAVAAPAIADETVTEPSTEQSFPVARTAGGRPLALLGIGVRRKLIVKVYVMALYVDAEEARHSLSALVARAGGRDRRHLLDGDHAQTFVIWGAFTKLAVLKFVRAVDADKIREAFQEGLEDELSERAPPELRKAAGQFIALFDRGLKEGSEILLRTDADGHIAVELAGEKREGPSNPKLARAIWAIWLGPNKTISTEMRRSLVERLDTLAK